MIHVTNKEVFEIFEDFTKLKTKKDKVLFIREQGNLVPAVKDVIRGAFDDRLKFVLPVGKPPYTPNRPESVPSSLKMLHRQFSTFVVGATSEGLGQMHIEKKFIQMLESIHAEDALIVLDMVAKKPPVKGLTVKIVEEAFPNLLP
jgi:hypothetical protein|tara:strand:- start:8436 stop:8870 length:435 start_codon:yes stop_codon:yes gene_type:complete